MKKQKSGLSRTVLLRKELLWSLTNPDLIISRKAVLHAARITRCALKVSPPQTRETSWKSLKPPQLINKVLVVRGKPVRSQVTMCPRNIVLEVIPFQAELVLFSHPAFESEI